MDRTVGDYFISDSDDALEQVGEAKPRPVVVPATAPAAPVAPPAPLASPAPTVSAPPAAVPAIPTVAAPLTPSAPLAAAAESPAPPAVPTPPIAGVPSKGEQLAAVLDGLIAEDSTVHAAALVSLDGLTMASALPDGMEPDRVGAMSAAILGLGERAAAELGRGRLEQVIIEGDDGYVILLAAGSYAVLTTVADGSAKLGLVLYEMRAAADRVAAVLG